MVRVSQHAVPPILLLLTKLKKKELQQRNNSHYVQTHTHTFYVFNVKMLFNGVKKKQLKIGK